MASTTTQYSTVFGSLDQYDKGGVEAIDDDPKHYVFSNMFEVAANAAPWEKVAVGKNMEYVLEVHPRRGHLAVAGDRRTTSSRSSWTARSSIELVELDEPLVDADGRRLGRRRRRARRHRDGPHRGVAAATWRCCPPGALPLRGRRAERDPAADDRGPRHRRALGRDLPVELTPETSTRND